MEIPKTDYHIHTNFTDAGLEMGISSIIKRAEELGLEEIAITDHVRKDSVWITEYLEWIENVKSSSDVKIFPGFETKILPDGSLDIPKKYIDKKYMIIASFHGFEGNWFDALSRVLKSKYARIIGHFGGSEMVPMFLPTENEIRAIAENIERSGAVIELNARNVAPPEKFMRMFLEYKIDYCLGSDAHSLIDIGNFDGIRNLINMVENSGRRIIKLSY